MKELRESLGTDGYGKRVVEKVGETGLGKQDDFDRTPSAALTTLTLPDTQVYKQDIERLLSMEDMWKHRMKPIPLDYEQLAAAPSSSEASNGSGGIKDQRTLSVKDSFDLFLDR